MVNIYSQILGFNRRYITFLLVAFRETMFGRFFLLKRYRFDFFLKIIGRYISESIYQIKI